MPAFNLVPAPVFSPTHCVCCLANRDGKGFVDLLADQVPVNGFAENGDPMPGPTDGPRFGHLYICVTCLEQAIHVAGGLSRDEAEELRGDRALLAAKNGELEAELEQERSPEGKLISVEQLIEYLRQPHDDEPELEAPEPEKPKRGRAKAKA